jgi:hypothetical protein
MENIGKIGYMEGGLVFRPRSKQAQHFFASFVHLSSCKLLLEVDLLKEERGRYAKMQII